MKERDDENIKYGWDEEGETETQIEKCHGCGANMVFDPESQCLICNHCGTKKDFSEKARRAEELSLAQAFEESVQRDGQEKTSVFSCDNCGAKVVLAAGETAKSCPFCGTAHVQVSQELAGLKPNALVPFILNEQKALENSKLWAKKRFFAPRKFKKNINTDNVRGVYMPCFTFDSATFSGYHGRIGKTHVKYVGSGKDRRMVTYTVWHDISGTYSDAFNDLLVTAGSKLGQKQLNKVSPFDTDNGKSFKEEYMLGFMAYHYDREIVECWGNAKDMMDDIIRRRILAKYDYDTLGYLNVSTQHENVTYKYVMLPVYVGNYNYNKKLYNFYVNGETGKVWGKIPLSIPKILGVIALGIAAVAWVISLIL